MKSAKLTVILAGLAILVTVNVPMASAKILDETGVCLKSECTWVDNSGDIHNCESNGNVAVINGEDNHVNYCHDEGNATSP